MTGALVVGSQSEAELRALLQLRQACGGPYQAVSEAPLVRSKTIWGCQWQAARPRAESWDRWQQRPVRSFKGWQPTLAVGGMLAKARSGT